MKKAYKVPLFTLMTIVTTVACVSAGSPTFVASVTGSAPTTTAVDMGVRASIFRYNQDNKDTRNTQIDEKEYETMLKVNNEKNENDLKMYTSYSNSDITSVSTTDNRVSITRAIPVKLFGFISATTTETATIISFGEGSKQIVVSRPFWNFFTTSVFTKDTVAGDIEANIKSIPDAEFSFLLSTTTKVLLLTKIRESFFLTSSSSVVIK
jgi:hypothetical protein